MLAFGTQPGLPAGPASYDFWPLLLIPLVALTIRRVLGYPMNAFGMAASFVVGSILGWAIASWGVVVPVGIAVLVVCLLALGRRPSSA
jgi:hypothetical protein